MSYIDYTTNPLGSETERGVIIACGVCGRPSVIDIYHSGIRYHHRWPYAWTEQDKYSCWSPSSDCLNYGLGR